MLVAIMSVTEALCRSAELGDSRRIIELLDDDVNPNFFSSRRFNRTALHLAAANGHEDIVLLLLKVKCQHCVMQFCNALFPIRPSRRLGLLWMPLIVTAVRLSWPQRKITNATFPRVGRALRSTGSVPCSLQDGFLSDLFGIMPSGSA